MAEKQAADVSSVRLNSSSQVPRVVKNPLLSASVTGITFDDFPNKPLLLPAAPPIVQTTSAIPGPISSKEAESLVTVGHSSKLDNEKLDEINLNSSEDSFRNRSSDEVALDSNSNPLVNTDSILSQAASSFSALPAVASNVFSTFSKRLYAGSRETTPTSISATLQDFNGNFNQQSDPRGFSLDSSSAVGSLPPPQFPNTTPVQSNSLDPNTSGEGLSGSAAPPEPPKFYKPGEVSDLASAVAPPTGAAPGGPNSYRLSAKKKVYAPIPGLSEQAQNVAVLPTQEKLASLSPIVESPANSASFSALSQPQDPSSNGAPIAPPSQQPSSQDPQRRSGGLFSLGNFVPSGVYRNISGLVQSATGGGRSEAPTSASQDTSFLPSSQHPYNNSELYGNPASEPPLYQPLSGVPAPSIPLQPFAAPGPSPGFPNYQSTGQDQRSLGESIGLPPPPPVSSYQSSTAAAYPPPPPLVNQAANQGISNHPLDLLPPQQHVDVNPVLQSAAPNPTRPDIVAEPGQQTGQLNPVTVFDLTRQATHQVDLLRKSPNPATQLSQNVGAPPSFLGGQSEAPENSTSQPASGFGPFREPQAGYIPSQSLYNPAQLPPQQSSVANPNFGQSQVPQTQRQANLYNPLGQGATGPPQAVPYSTQQRVGVPTPLEQAPAEPPTPGQVLGAVPTPTPVPVPSKLPTPVQALGPAPTLGPTPAPGPAPAKPPTPGPALGQAGALGSVPVKPPTSVPTVGSFTAPAEAPTPTLAAAAPPALIPDRTIPKPTTKVPPKVSAQSAPTSFRLQKGTRQYKSPLSSEETAPTFPATVPPGVSTSAASLINPFVPPQVTSQFQNYQNLFNPLEQQAAQLQPVNPYLAPLPGASSYIQDSGAIQSNHLQGPPQNPYLVPGLQPFFAPHPEQQRPPVGVAPSVNSVGLLRPEQQTLGPAPGLPFYRPPSADVSRPDPQSVGPAPGVPLYRPPSAEAIRPDQQIVGPASGGVPLYQPPTGDAVRSELQSLGPAPGVPLYRPPSTEAVRSDQQRVGPASGVPLYQPSSADAVRSEPQSIGPAPDVPLYRPPSAEAIRAEQKVAGPALYRPPSVDVSRQKEGDPQGGRKLSQDRLTPLLPPLFPHQAGAPQDPFITPAVSGQQAPPSQGIPQGLETQQGPQLRPGPISSSSFATQSQIQGQGNQGSALIAPPAPQSIPLFAPPPSIQGPGTQVTPQQQFVKPAVNTSSDSIAQTAAINFFSASAAKAVEDIPFNSAQGVAAAQVKDISADKKPTDTTAPLSQINDLTKDFQEKVSTGEPKEPKVVSAPPLATTQGSSAGNPYRLPSVGLKRHSLTSPEGPIDPLFFTPSAIDLNETAPPAPVNFFQTQTPIKPIEVAHNLSSSPQAFINNTQNFFRDPLTQALPNLQQDSRTLALGFDKIAAELEEHKLTDPPGFTTSHSTSGSSFSHLFGFAGELEPQKQQQQDKPINTTKKELQNPLTFFDTFSEKPYKPGDIPKVERSGPEDSVLQNFFNNPPSKENTPQGIGDLNYDLVHSGVAIKNLHSRSLTPASNLVEPPSSACSEFSELNNSSASSKSYAPSVDSNKISVASTSASASASASASVSVSASVSASASETPATETAESPTSPTAAAEKESNTKEVAEKAEDPLTDNADIQESLLELKKHYEEIPPEILQQLRMAAAAASSQSSSQATLPDTPYTPAIKHWFYKKETSGKVSWVPFSHYDSALIETTYLQTGDETKELVAVEGGRFDVNIKERVKVPVFWEDKPIEVRRCSWFYKGLDSKYIPYDEGTADLLEKEYQKSKLSGEWHQKIILSMGEYVIFHGPSVLVHFQQQNTTDAWGGSTPTTSRPRVVKRDLEDFNIPPGESQRVDHLMFMVHGIGSVCDMRWRSLHEVVDDFRTVAQQLVQSHYKNSTEMGLVGRVEVLPISWHSHLHSGEVGIDEKLKAITLDSIPFFRNFTNDTLLDILFYTSPIYCQKIINSVTSSLNSIYLKYRERNPDFNGSVSVSGHSLGTLILFDMLCHQKTVKETEDENMEDPDLRFAAQAQEPQKELPTESSPTPMNYMIGPAGTGQPFIQYGQLVFQPKKFFAMGSPIGMFVTIRGIDKLGLDFRLPTCPNFYNIFHPFDPVAYRIEALVNPDMAGIRPVLIPHHKGRKRMHLELKETVSRVGADLKQRFMDTFKTTLESVNFLATSSRAKKETDDTIQREVNQALDQIEEQEKRLLVSGGKASESGTAVAGGAATGSRERTSSVSTTISDSEMVEVDFPLGKLNDSKRIDYVLQEAPLEFFNEYLFAMGSHVCYWESEDTILFIMKEIYNGLGISPDSQVPQQTMTIERPVQKD